MDTRWALSRSGRAALANASDAVQVYSDVPGWLASLTGDVPPLAVEIWVFDQDLRHTLLVRHRWRGWVPPGGKVEPAETPREAASRELREETGLEVPLMPRTAAVTVRAYRRDWAPTLGLAYAVVASAAAALTPEPDQAVAWMPLHQDWSSCFPEDPARLRRHARWLGYRTGAAPDHPSNRALRTPAPAPAGTAPSHAPGRTDRDSIPRCGR